MTEKILARHSGNSVVRPGENIWTEVDKLLTHDVCGPGTFGIFQNEFGMDVPVWDKEKVVIIPDHYIFTDDPRANRNVDILRDIAKQYDHVREEFADVEKVITDKLDELEKEHDRRCQEEMDEHK